TSGGVDWDWDDAGVPLLLYEGRVLEGVPVMDGIWDAVRVTGLPPATRVARPGEFLAVYADDTDVTGEVVQVLAPAVSSAAGVATIRLFSPLGAGGRVNIGVSDTGVFRQLETPRAVQPLGGDWSYTWSFREVFADEAGGFAERDPWS
uniref:hypothetical protein n=1 Tax=Oceanicella sp. SM1341 TaxID=1548889 RepID=UPI0013009845